MMAKRASNRRSFLYRNGLSLCFGALMVLALVAHAWAGWRLAQEEARDQHRAAPTLVAYLASGEFHSSVFEAGSSRSIPVRLESSVR